MVWEGERELNYRPWIGTENNGRLRNLTGYGSQFHACARTSALHCARFNGPAERVGVCRTVQGVQMEVVGMYFWNS